MPDISSASLVKMAFEEKTACIAFTDIQPLRIIGQSVKRTVNFARIAASIQEVGIIEPLVVAREKGSTDKYILLDGHLRLEVLKEMGKTETVCLISTDDEAFTYNKRVNRLATVQEHKMILKAIDRGVPEARIAQALNIDIHTLRQKKSMLEGLCQEAIALLKDKHVPVSTLAMLKRMLPIRQIEAAELMIAMNKYTISYAKSLLAATPQNQLVNFQKPKQINGLGTDQLELMERESATLEREFKMAEQSYGTDHLDLVLAKGYLSRLLSNARIVGYLASHHHDLLVEFQKLVKMENTAA